MNCNFLYIDEIGLTHCDCASPKSGGQISDTGTCKPNICKIPKKQREAEVSR